MNFSVLNKIQQQAEEIKDIIDQIKALEEGLNYLNYPKHSMLLLQAKIRNMQLLKIKKKNFMEFNFILKLLIRKMEKNLLATLSF